MVTIHKHNHIECKHENLKFCSHCKVPYCLDCAKEWKEFNYSYAPYTSGVGVYPLTGKPLSWGTPMGDNTLNDGHTQQALEVTCATKAVGTINQAVANAAPTVTHTH